MQSDVKHRMFASQSFEGRRDILRKLENYFTGSVTSLELRKQRRFVLYGLGGAGKTQIVLKFLEQAADRCVTFVSEFIQQSYDPGTRFTKVFFVTASSEQILRSAFENIAREARAGSTAEDAVQWLAQQEHEWLLVLDNADDPELSLNPWIPACRHGNIIITTRNPACSSYAPKWSVEIGSMDPEEAVLLLLKCSRAENSPEASKIAGIIVYELGQLALAIVQAGSFIAMT
jgi:hypothetical protein